jgi:hypothetical protein
MIKSLLSVSFVLSVVKIFSLRTQRDLRGPLRFALQKLGVLSDLA